MKVTWEVEPNLAPVVDEKWRHGCDWSYTIDKEDGTPPVTHVIPKGRITDLDSVPRLPFVYWLLKGRARIAACVHDDLYKTQAGKELSDEAFRAAMVTERVKNPWRHWIYLGPKLLGQKSYDDYGTKLTPVLDTAPAELGE
jgi:hypothetical protein